MNPFSGLLGGGNPFSGLLNQQPDDEEMVRDPLSGRMIPKSQAHQIATDRYGSNPSHVTDLEERPDYPSSFGKKWLTAGMSQVAGVVAGAPSPLFRPLSPLAKAAKASGRDGLAALLDPIGHAEEVAREADAQATQQLADASVNLPTPVATAGYLATEFLSPAELLPGGLAAGAVARGARKLRGAAAVVEDLGPKVADPDLLELAEASQRIGASPAATKKVASVVDVTPEGSGAIRHVRALDESGAEVGSMTFSVEPQGGFRVMDVSTGERGTGGMRAMYQKAAEVSKGPRLGSSAQTSEGAGAVARLQETNPELFPSKNLPRAGASEASPAKSEAMGSSDPVRDAFLEKYSGEVPEPAPQGNPVKRFFERVYNEIWNSDAPIEDFLKSAGHRESAMVAGRLRGANEVARGPLKLGTTRYDDATGELVFTGEPLEAIIKGMDGETQSDLKALMMAQRQAELSERASLAKGAGAQIGLKGVDPTATEESVKLTEHLQQKLGDEAFADLADRARRIRSWSEKAIVEPLVDVGLISEDDAGRLLQANQSYVPFHRIAKMIEEAGGAEGSGKSLMKEITQGLSEKARIADPLEELVIKSQRVHRWVERQRVRNQVGDAIDKLGEDFGRIAKPGELASEKSFPVFRDGKAQHYIPADKEMMRALERGGSGDANLVIKALSFPVRLLRAGATLTLEFIQRNPVRDQVTGAVNSKYGYIPFYDFAKGLFHMSPAGRRLSRIYDEYLSSGSAMSSMASVDRPHAASTLRDLTGSGSIAQVGKFARHWRQEGVLYPLQLLSGGMEAATRVGGFARARAKGATAGEAMLEARDLTLDFGRSGRSGRIGNGLYAFLNANLQDLDRVRRAFRDRPAATSAKTLAYITIPSVANWAANRDNPDYQSLQEYDKAAFYHLGQLPNGTFVRFPRPLGVLSLVAGYGVEKFLDHAIREDPEAVEKFIERVIEQTPVGYVADPQQLIPTGLEPIAEVTAGPGGWDHFRNRPIVPRSLQGLDPSEQYTDYTPEIVRDIGGATGVSPLKIQHAVEGYTAGVGKSAVEILDAIYREAKGEDPGRLPSLPPTAKTIPGAGAFVSPSPYGFGSEPVDKLYQLSAAAETAYRTYNRKQLTQGAPQLLQYKAEHPELDPAYRKRLREAKKNLQDLHQRRDKIRRLAHITAEKRAEELLRIDQMVTQYAAQQIEMLEGLQR